MTIVAGMPPRDVLDLRREVFVEEQGIAAELEYDGRDADADHAVLRASDGTVLATARLLDPAADGHGHASHGHANHDHESRDHGSSDHDQVDEPCGTIGRVAVRRSARGRGLGRAVTAALERRARDRGLTVIELHAQQPVEGFYLRQGYRPRHARFGPVRDVVAGIPHVWMRRELVPGLRRVRDSDGPALERLVGAVWSEYPGCVLDVDAEEPWMRAPASAYAGRAGPWGGPWRGAMWVVPADGVPEGPSSRRGDLIACVAMRLRPDASSPADSPADGSSLVCELKSLYVAASARRRGIGEALVRRVEREARSCGAAVVELWTDTRFTDAHRLYSRLGYARTGRTRELHDLSATVEYEFRRRLPATGSFACLPAP